MLDNPKRKPSVSVVVVVYNMPREAPRTLHSLSASYQRHIDPDDYEVIVVDNGSNPPFDTRVIEGLSGNFRLVRIDDASPSPAPAVNRGLAEALGDVIGVMIDGARIVTPGLLHFASQGTLLDKTAVVVAPGWRMRCSPRSTGRRTAIACSKSRRWMNLRSRDGCNRLLKRMPCSCGETYGTGSAAWMRDLMLPAAD